MPKTVTLICQYNGHEWERESQRGRRPLYCPEHSGAMAASAASADALATGAVSVPKVAIDPEAVAKVFAEYEVAFDRANKVNTPEAWHIADVLQARAIGMSNRARANA